MSFRERVPRMGCGTACWNGMASGCHSLVSYRDLCPRMSPGQGVPAVLLYLSDTTTDVTSTCPTGIHIPGCPQDEVPAVLLQLSDPTTDATENLSSCVPSTRCPCSPVHMCLMAPIPVCPPGTRVPRTWHPQQHCPLFSQLCGCHTSSRLIPTSKSPATLSSPNQNLCWDRLNSCFPWRILPKSGNLEPRQPGPQGVAFLLLCSLIILLNKAPTAAAGPGFRTTLFLTATPPREISNFPSGHISLGARIITQY